MDKLRAFGILGAFFSTVRINKLPTSSLKRNTNMLQQEKTQHMLWLDSVNYSKIATDHVIYLLSNFSSTLLDTIRVPFFPTKHHIKKQ